MMCVFFYNSIERYVNVLLSPPGTMVKTWARLQPRTQILLQELTRCAVDNYDSLLAAWRKDKLYLLAVYQSWIPESLHSEAAALWPPV